MKAGLLPNSSADHLKNCSIVISLETSIFASVTNNLFQAEVEKEEERGEENSVRGLIRRWGVTRSGRNQNIAALAQHRPLGEYFFFPSKKSF